MQNTSYLPQMESPEKFVELIEILIGLNTCNPLLFDILLLASPSEAEKREPECENIHGSLFLCSWRHTFLRGCKSPSLPRLRQNRILRRSTRIFLDMLSEYPFLFLHTPKICPDPNRESETSESAPCVLPKEISLFWPVLLLHPHLPICKKQNTRRSLQKEDNIPKERQD